MPKQYLPEPVLEIIRSVPLKPGWAEEVGRQMAALEKGQREIANTARTATENRYKGLRNGQHGTMPMVEEHEKPISRLSRGAFSTMPPKPISKPAGDRGHRTPEQRARMAAAQKARWAKIRGEQ